MRSYIFIYDFISAQSLRCVVLVLTSGVSLFFGVLMSWGVVAGWVRDLRTCAIPRGKNFLKQGLLVHSEQIVKDGVDTGFLLYLLN